MSDPHLKLAKHQARHSESGKEGRLMTASTMVRTDEEIQQDVIAELKWDARIAPNKIGVIVTDGVVTLTGWVDSYSKKWAAERAAHRVRGVKAVANDLEVRMPSSAEKPGPISTIWRFSPAALYCLMKFTPMPPGRKM